MEIGSVLTATVISDARYRGAFRYFATVCNGHPTKDRDCKIKMKIK